MVLFALIIALSAIIYPIHIIFFVVGFLIAYYCVPRRYTKPKKVNDILLKMQKSTTSLNTIPELSSRNNGVDPISNDKLLKLEQMLIKLKFNDIKTDIQARKDLTYKLVSYYQQLIYPFIATTCDIFKPYEKEELGELIDIYDQITKKESIFTKLNQKFAVYSELIESKTLELITSIKPKYENIMIKQKNLTLRLNDMQNKIGKHNALMEQLMYEYHNLEFLVTEYNSDTLICVKAFIADINKHFINLFEELNYIKQDVFDNSPFSHGNLHLTADTIRKKNYTMNEVHIQAQYMYKNLKLDVKNLLGIDAQQSDRERHVKKYKMICKLMEQSLKQALQYLSEFYKDKNRFLDNFGVYHQLDIDTRLILDKLLAFRNNYKVLRESKFESNNNMLRIVKLFSDLIDHVIILLKQHTTYSYINLMEDDIIATGHIKALSRQSSIGKYMEELKSHNSHKVLATTTKETELITFFNKLLKIFFKEWSTNNIYKMRMIRKLERKMNKKPIPNFRLFKVNSVTLTDDPMIIRNVKIVNDEDYLIAFDMQVVYQGLFSIIVSTDVDIHTKFVK